VSTYTYWSTHLVTGAVLADNLPISVSSMTRTIGAIGQLTGTLVLSGNAAQDRVYVNALDPRRSVLWVAQDGYPIWCGIVWDWTPQSVLDGTLPFSASTVESILQKREITTLLTYSGDVFDTVRALISYALSKTPNGGASPLQIGTTNKAGVNYAVSYTPTDLAKVWDAITGITTASGFEFAFNPGLSQSGVPQVSLQLAYPKIGAPSSQNSVVFQYPGNLLDYGYQQQGSSAANTLRASAPPNGSAASWQSQLPHGQDTADLAAGYPLLEDSISYVGTGITSQAQIDAFADGQLPARTAAQQTPLVTLAPGAKPLLRQLSLGDYCWLVATSPLHPATSTGAPGLRTLCRIVGWTATPPGKDQGETIRIQLGGVPGGITL
jgi:hypothetical protein